MLFAPQKCVTFTLPNPQPNFLRYQKIFTHSNCQKPNEFEKNLSNPTRAHRDTWELRIERSVNFSVPFTFAAQPQNNAGIFMWTKFSVKVFRPCHACLILSFSWVRSWNTIHLLSPRIKQNFEVLFASSNHDRITFDSQSVTELEGLLFPSEIRSRAWKKGEEKEAKIHSFWECLNNKSWAWRTLLSKI